MEKIVLDTNAVMAFFYDEDGARTVEEIIADAKKNSMPILMCAVNYGEFFYVVQKRDGHEPAIKACDMLDSIPVHVIDADRDLSLLAGSIKAEKKMSYAGCFAAATAMIHKAALVTGDREFEEVEKEIKVVWI